MAFNNQRLYDVLTRHQLYLEGVKAGFAGKLSGAMLQAANAILPIIKSLQVQSLDQLTKAQLNVILSQLAKAQAPFFNAWILQFQEDLQTLLAADVKVTKIALATMQAFDYDGEDDPEPVSEDEANAAISKSDDGVNVWPLAWLIIPANLIRLWYVIAAAPLPANGALPMEFAQAWSTLAQTKILQAVTKGYANKSTPAQVVADLSGIVGGTGGIFNTAANQGSVVVDTIVQHVSSIAQAAVQSHFESTYIWISVLDSKTTEICIERDGNIYVYGAGPLPPAHMRCRSKTALYVDGTPTQPRISYFDWLTRQPPAVQDDILGAKLGAKLRAGKLKSSDVPSPSNAAPLSIDEFVSKLGTMLTR
jgi:hypothetical protein